MQDFTVDFRRLRDLLLQIDQFQYTEGNAEKGKRLMDFAATVAIHHLLALNSVASLAEPQSEGETLCNAPPELAMGAAAICNILEELEQPISVRQKEQERLIRSRSLGLRTASESEDERYLAALQARESQFNNLVKQILLVFGVHNICRSVMYDLQAKISDTRWWNWLMFEFFAPEPWGGTDRP